MSEILSLFDEFWAKSIIWFSGTFMIVKFIRVATVNLDKSDDLSVKGKNVIKSHLKKVADKESEHWVNDFGLITDSIFGKKLLSFRSFILSAIISSCLYFIVFSIMFKTSNRHQASLGGSNEIYFMYVVLLFPFVNVFFDFISLFITRMILRLKKVKNKAKIIIDLFLSIILIVCGLIVFINGTQRVLLYLKSNDLSALKFSEWLYDAEIKIDNVAGGRYISYKSKYFNYTTFEEGGFFSSVHISLTGDTQTREKMEEERGKAQTAINIAMISASGFKEALSDSGAYTVSISLFAVFVTSLSTSIWLWIHGISIYTMSIVRKYTRDFRLLNVDNKPIQVIGLITCAYVISISLVSYFVFLMFMV